MHPEIIAAGAESILVRIGNIVNKIRIPKHYRIKEIDEIFRRERTKMEARIMEKCKRLGIPVPAVISKSDFVITMEYIEGKTLRDIIDEEGDSDRVRKIVKEVGKYVGRMHYAGIAHGDLTTSNVIVRDSTPYLIDFGLSKYTQRIEDFAVDLLLMKRALESRHFKYSQSLFTSFLEGYREAFPNADTVISRMHEILKRGRYVRR